MLIDGKELDEQASFECDLCIVGGGVAGSVLATELVDSGIDIIILEAGEEFYDEEVQEAYRAESIPKHFDDPYSSRLRMLGGSSNHWENSTEEFDPIDFERRSWIPNSGWPISYDDVKPFYPKAGEYCNVGSAGFDGKTWKKALPFEDILDDSSDLETSVTKTATYSTAFFDDHLSQIIDEKNIRVITRATLTDIIYSGESRNITSITFNSLPGRAHTVRAKLFVMGLGGIENTRLLLSFNEKYNNQIGNSGGNVGRYFMEHPTIRGLHFYPFENKPLPEVYAQPVEYDSFQLKARIKVKEETLYRQNMNNLRFTVVPQTHLILSHGVSSAHILKKHAAQGEVADDFGSHVSNVLGDLGMVADGFSRKMFDKKITDKGDEFGGYQVITMIDQSPEANNQILLGSEPDRYGLKRVKINWSMSDFDKYLTWKTLEFVAKDETLNQFGRFRLLKERESRIWESQLGYGHHHMGTTRMAGSVKNGVVDKNCLVFGTNNLYIAGSSVFPTGGHVPPTLTIVAMSIRLARHLERIIKV